MMLRAFFIILCVLALPLHAALPVQEVKSSKGITAWLQEDQSLPVVSIAFAWRGGFESDPDNRQGLGTLAASMLVHGAGEYDDNQFQQALQQKAITIGFDARRDMIHGAMRSLKEALPEAVKLLKASITAPRFEDAALLREKDRQLTRLKFNMADPDWLVLRLAMSEIFAGHVYSKRALGNPASINAIAKDDLKSWMKNLARDNLVVTATGAITAAELSKIVDDVFGALPEKNPQPAVAESTMAGGGQSFAVKLPGPQVQLLMIWPGLKRDDKDWYTLEVMDYILGGGSFSSRLMKEIREKRGLTYGMSSAPSPLAHAGFYTVQASFEGKNTAEVLRLTQEEVKKISSAPVSAEELQEAKDYLIGSYPLELTSTSSIAAHLLGLRMDLLPMNEEQKRATAIRAVTAEQVQAMAKKIFAASPAVFYVGAPQGVTVGKTVEGLD